MFTSSPINIPKLQGQNLRLYQHLSSGKPIHVLHPAKSALHIGYLNSRISDLIHKNNIPIQSRFIKVPDKDGQPVTVKEYFIP